MQQLKGRGLFVFSDPGGAKPLLALVKSVADRLKDYYIISDREYGFFREFGLEVNKPKDAAADITTFNPDFIFTGTSYTSQLDLRYIEAGNARGIPTYAFVDHWTNIRERFSKNGTEILPDTICLVDEKARHIALQQDLGADRLQVIGNPFQDYLRSWKPTSTRADFFAAIGINPGNKKVLVFAPDPLSNVQGIDKFGFDEVQVMKELWSISDNILSSHALIFKPHPNQDMSRLPVEMLEKIFVADQNIDNNSLIYHSDVIMGFFSSYLMEAQIMNKKVLRYLPETSINDPFGDLDIGTVVNKDTLVAYL